jgi:hypothetical protein
MFASKRHTVTLRDVAAHCDDPFDVLRKLAAPDRISIGQVACVAGADAALQCSLALDWQDIGLRRTMIAIMVRWIRRGYPLMDDADVIEDLGALREWAEGDESVDLRLRRRMLLKEVTNMPSEQPHTSDETAIAQTWMLLEVALQLSPRMSKWTNCGAASVTMVGAQLIAAAVSDAKERQQQVEDLQLAFP